MSTATLEWTCDLERWRFGVRAPDGKQIPVSRWARDKVRVPAGTGSVGHLLALLDEDRAEALHHDAIVAVPHPEIAALDAIELRRLGLPPPAPYRLEIRGSGLLTSAGFRFHFRLVDAQGLPVLGGERTGAHFKAGKEQFTLLDPIFSLVSGMSHFNEMPPEDVDSRFLEWGRLKALLPDDAVVDGHLRGINIVRADAFTLDSAPDARLIPVLLGQRGDEHRGDGGDPAFDQVLPPSAQDSFADRFRAHSAARARYAVEGGWYVVFGRPLHRALSVVREYQERSPEERRGFLANPQSFLRERLADSLQDEELELLFQETPLYLSARISHLGEWNPKVCAYKMPSSQSWLPPEEALLGIPVNGSLVRVPVNRVPEVIGALEAAIAADQRHVEFEGQRIPATEESLEAFSRLVKPRKGMGGSGGGGSEAPAHPELVPIIIDNLDEMGYAADPRGGRGQVGGLPAVIRTTAMYEHQLQGLRWLQEHWVHGSRGALLADDMGLGKTLQALAFLAWVQEQWERAPGERRPILVVAPTGLLRNWEAEAERHLAGVGIGRLVRAYGSELKPILARSQREQRREFQEADWTLTTYETLRDRVRAFVGVEWGVAVFDEAQKIKNPESRMTEMAKSLQVQFMLALTGTPVENRLADLWSILDAATPGLLGSLKDFHSRYEKPASADPEAARTLAEKLMRESTPPVLMRRMKEDHLPGLPSKTELLHEETMSADQAAAYSSAVAQARSGDRSRGKMLEVLHSLRRLSLMIGEPGESGLTDADIAQSARLRAAIQVLDTIRPRGEKVLMFVEYLDLQELLVPYLQQRYGLSRPPMRINGGVPGARRKEFVDAFQAKEAGTFDVMLLSPRAGGVGITLTAANHVIHLTRWWNPAVEDQCTDRVYRIGQDRDVQVHVPMAIHPEFSEHSFDCSLHRLLARKRRLSRAVLAPAVASDSDLESLFDAAIAGGN